MYIFIESSTAKVLFFILQDRKITCKTFGFQRLYYASPRQEAIHPTNKPKSTLLAASTVTIQGEASPKLNYVFSIPVPKDAISSLKFCP